MFCSKSAQDYFAHGNHGFQADSRLTQSSVAKDICSFVVKEVQQYVEQDNLLEQSSTADSILRLSAIIELDLEKAVPTVDRQVACYALAGIASRYIPENIQKSKSPKVITETGPLVDSEPKGRGFSK